MMATAAERRCPRGRILRDEPMRRHTAWGIGGPAERFFEPEDVRDLAAFMAGLDAAEPLFWLGFGSNLLVRDGGLQGTVVHTGRLGAIEHLGDGRLWVECGAPCPKVARAGARLGLAGSEFLAGIPGSMGGALAMNAGAFGGETWTLVARVETVDRAGTQRTRSPDAFEVGYRHVRGPAGEWFLGAELHLAEDVDEAAQARIKALLARRAATQPLRTRNCGSVFRNPSGDHAARLIEASGLKGTRVGGAEVSEKHANFIVNVGGASAADVEALMTLVVERVARDSAIRLEPEVRIVGRAAAPGVVS
jgi:UDP-N-acetylmuramate dehydrogenase